MSERLKVIEVLTKPAEFARLRGRDLSRAVCVVFDVLRATSTMATALTNGAAGIIPVETIAEAVAWRAKSPEVLLAGERDGVRIRATQSGGVDFDFGNSPREFTREAVAGRTIVTTTTNGTRALRTCAGARRVFAGSFLNLSATVAAVKAAAPEQLVLVGSGTGEDEALEDNLAIEAFVAQLKGREAERLTPLWERHRDDLPGAMRLAANGARLLANPDLRDDVAFCLRVDFLDTVAEQGVDGVVRAI